MNADSLTGTWRLISWELRDANGNISYPLGPDAAGHITYTADGYVSVLITGRSRRPAGPHTGDQEVPGPAHRTLAYAGTYECQDGLVIHHVELSSYPSWIGTDQERIVSREGDRLSLSTPPSLVNGKQRSAHLLWQRLSREEALEASA